MNQALTAIVNAATEMLLRVRQRGQWLVLALVLSATFATAWAAPTVATPPAARLRWGLAASPGTLDIGVPIELRLEVWVSTWFQAPVEFPATLSADGALVEQIAGSPDSRFEEFEGRRWTGLIRRYRVLPLQPGDIRISLPDAMVVQAGGADGLKLTPHPPAPLRLTVRLPVGAEDIQPFVAANRLSLRQRWLPEASPSASWQVGDLIQREVELNTDSSSPLLPQPDFGEPVGTRVRVGAPGQQEQRANAAATPVLTRQHRASYELTQAGAVTLPALEFVWWDLQQRRRRVTRLEGLTLLVQPATERPDPFAEPLMRAENSSSTPERGTLPVWVAATGVLVLGSMWLMRRRGGRFVVPLLQALGRRYAKARDWQMMRQACSRHDAQAAARALSSILLTLNAQEQLRWRSDTAFQTAVTNLAQWRFGPASLAGKTGWRGDALWAAVSALRRHDRRKHGQAELPGLSPGDAGR
ncbi:MAG: hypothetical protein ACOYNZ_06220 [Rhodoferax sp.]